MGHSFERVYLLQLLSMRAHCSVRRAIFAILKLAFVDVWAGSTIAFCEACAILKHSKFNILHRVEILRVGSNVMMLISRQYNCKKLCVD